MNDEASRLVHHQDRFVLEDYGNGDILRRESLLDVSIPPSVAVTAIGEALNYATDSRSGLDATASVARRVYDALAPRGIFLFDVATPGRNLGMEVRERIHDHDDWMLCMKATSSGIFVISTRLAMMVPKPPPTTKPANTQPMPVTAD